LTSYRGEVARVCQDTSIQHVIYTDVREYLPLRQRVLLASLIEGSMPHHVSSVNGSKSASGAAVDATVIQTKSRPWREHELQPLLRRQHTAPLENGVTSGHLA